MTNSELLQSYDYDDVIIFRNPDYEGALVGVNHDGTRAIYDYNLMVKSLMETDGMSEEEAIEFIDYNTFGVININDKYPIVINFLRGVKYDNED